MAKQKNRAQAAQVHVAESNIQEVEASVSVEEAQPVLPNFNFILRVINPFKGYQKASEIRNPLLIQAVIDEGDLPNCVKVLINSEE